MIFIKLLRNLLKTTRANKQVQQDCRIQDQHKKLIVFLYICNEQPESEIEKTLPFTIPLKNNKIRADPEGIMLSAVSQTEKDTHHVISLTCGI